MKRKVFALILASVMIMSLFTGCLGSINNGNASVASPVQSDSTTQATTTKKENFNPTGYPVVDEKITVKAMYSVNKASIGDPDETAYWKKLEELTNVHIDWEIIDTDQTKVNLYFAAGDFPDFFLGSLTSERINLYGIQGGYFQDISKMIYECMPQMVSRFQEWPQAEKIIRQLNGEVYTIPQIRLGTTAAECQIYYRTDYVESVGMSAPKTVDDFYNLLKAIKDAGLTKGYAPLCPVSKGHLAMKVEGFLFPAFGDAVEPGFADDGTGKVVFNYTSEQYKRCLEYMRMLYADGLLENEIFSMDSDTTEARVTSGLASFMTYASQLKPESFADGKVHVGVLAPLVSEYTSTQKVPAYAYLSTSTGGINKNSKYAREILRVLDIGYAKEEVSPGTGLEAIACNSGIKGEAYIVDPETNTYEFVVPEDYTKAVWGYVRLKHAWNVPYGVYDFKYYNKNPNSYAREKGMMTNLVPYSVDTFPDKIMHYTAEESLLIANKLTDISSHVEQMRAKFITGIEPFSNWDAYVAAIEKMGIEDVLQVKQAAYDRWNK